jgi:O-antigen ligase
MARRASPLVRFSLQFWGLVAFLAVAFLTGGGSRGDIVSLIALRPLSVLACGAGCLTLTRAHIQRFKFLFVFAALILAISIMSLIPLPPAIWGNLPGRNLLVEIDQAAGLGSVWRPLAMVPPGAWNALYSLFTPLAVLLLGAQLNREERSRILLVLLGLGLISGLVGMLQVVGAPDGPLYFYSVTNNGSAVGLFSNRNHAAVYLACLFPMLAVYAMTGERTTEQARFRAWMALGAGTFIIPLLLVTGSRSGVLTGLLGLTAVAFLFRKPEIDQPVRRRVQKVKLGYVFAGLAVMGLGLLTLLFARARALERLFAPDQNDDGRTQIWEAAARMAWTYFPVGSGPGSFVEAYQIGEPYALLSPDYTNHAHNDWIEIFMTGGVLGSVLLLLAVMACVRQSFAVWQRQESQSSNVALARMASVLILIFAVASVADYPLRVPSLMCAATMCAIWLAGGSRKSTGSELPRRKMVEVAPTLV